MEMLVVQADVPGYGKYSKGPSHCPKHTYIVYLNYVIVGLAARLAVLAGPPLVVLVQLQVKHIRHPDGVVSYHQNFRNTQNWLFNTMASLAEKLWT